MVVAGLAAIALAGITRAAESLPTPAGAEAYAAALRAASGSEVEFPLNIAGALPRCGIPVFGTSYVGLVATNVAWLALGALGSSWGGEARSAGGGALAALLALGSGAAVLAAGQLGAAAPWFSLGALGLGAALSRRWAAAAAAALLLGVVALQEDLQGLLAGSSWNEAPTVPALVGVASAAGSVIALLQRGDPGTVALVGAGGVLVALEVWTGWPFGLIAASVLALAAAGVTARWARIAVSLLAIGQWILVFLPERAPAAIRVPTGGPAGALADVDPVVDWLSAADGGTVAVYTTDEPLHPSLLAARSAERGVRLAFRPYDATEETDLGLVAVPATGAAPEAGWRAQLPPRAAVLRIGDTEISLYDRGLPPPSMLGGVAGAAWSHPSAQALWVYMDGAPRGPLLTPASSPEVIRTEAGWEVVYVRDQALWRASSPDGLTFGEPRPLSDATGPISAFDPAIVRLPDGGLRLFAAELAGDARDVDPAAHPTRIVSWTGASLDTLVREAGERIAGVGLVDPSVLSRAAGGGWRMYATSARSSVLVADSPDGDRFVEALTFPGITVPHVVPGGLVVQRQVGGWPALALARGDAEPRLVLLELCGTGPSLVEGRLYYTRGAEDCPRPVALPERRAALDRLLRGGDPTEAGRSPSVAPGSPDGPGAP